MDVSLLTLSDASHHLRCSAAWVARLFDQGVLPGVRDSHGRRLVEEGPVLDLAKRRARHPKTERETVPVPAQR